MAKIYIYVEVKRILLEAANIFSNILVIVYEELKLTPHHPSTPTVTPKFSQPQSSSPPLLWKPQGAA